MVDVKVFTIVEGNARFKIGKLDTNRNVRLLEENLNGQKTVCSRYRQLGWCKTAFLDLWFITFQFRPTKNCCKSDEIIVTF